ncbi:MAG: ImmA/IrrE family metallo-endopeptidase [Nitrospira sp.]|nr:ImmA/IrrE family metallo-endopeptidase [Nitrospira sp.]
MVTHVRDTTGRFGMRPHYTEEELDAECEQVISSFMRRLHGDLCYPISTDDLTKLIEEHVDDLDLYANLFAYGEDVEGVTEFLTGRRPRVKIARYLSEDPRYENRLRTTLTHEFGHVCLHAYLWQMQAMQGNLFKSQTQSHAPAACKRETITGAKKTDWMEWQAGYACGALLMPATPLKRLIGDYVREHAVYGTVTEHTAHGQALIAKTVRTFGVSRDAAQVRLFQLKFLSNLPSTKLLWD